MSPILNHRSRPPHPQYPAVGSAVKLSKRYLFIWGLLWFTLVLLVGFLAGLRGWL